MGKFQILRRKDDQFQFNLKANNGQVVLTSQGYTSKAGCESGIQSVRQNSQNADQFERRISANGKFYFDLMATNRQVIGTSQMYESTSSRDAGIDSVIANAVEAVLEG